MADMKCAKCGKVADPLISMKAGDGPYTQGICLSCLQKVPRKIKKILKKEKTNGDKDE